MKNLAGRSRDQEGNSIFGFTLYISNLGIQVFLLMMILYIINKYVLNSRISERKSQSIFKKIHKPPQGKGKGVNFS